MPLCEPSELSTHGPGKDGVAKVVLDTSAYARLRAGYAQVRERAAAARVIVVRVTVLGELDAGFELGRRAVESRRLLAEFLER